ncbi:MAG TPA: hypothetical protein VNM48_17670, partial [Chloroflexota bacterium]|nr:hypothetical protein [Chloroflexota bacterium]
FRTRHAYLLGATRMGKSTLLLNMIAQDALAGRGLFLIDPHGDLAQDVLAQLPPERVPDTLYLDLSDRDFPLSLGLLDASDEWEGRLLCSDLLSIFHRLFASSWGDRLEHILRHVLLTLLAQPGHTLRDIRPLLADKAYRHELLQHVRDPALLSFWRDEFPAYSSSSFAPLYNKLGLLLSSPLLRNIVVQPQSRLPVGQLIRHKSIVLVNLAQGLIGEDNAHFLGALLVSKIQIAAMQSLRHAPEERVPCTLYVDEFQHFVVSSFSKILSEAGKAGLSLVMANQFLEQLGEGLQTAILSNVGTLVSFRVSGDSARRLEREFGGHFNGHDLVDLAWGQAVVRIGQGSDSYALDTLPPPPPATDGRQIRHQAVERTRRLCCRPRLEVEALWQEMMQKEGKQESEGPPAATKVTRQPSDTVPTGVAKSATRKSGDRLPASDPTGVADDRVAEPPVARRAPSREPDAAPRDQDATRPKRTPLKAKVVRDKVSLSPAVEPMKSEAGTHKPEKPAQT